MNRVEVSELSLKLFAIFLFVKFLEAAPIGVRTVAGPLPYSEDPIMSTYYVLFRFWRAVSMLVPLFAFLILWKWAPRLAEGLWDRPAGDAGTGSASFAEIQAAVFSAIGLFAIVYTLPEALGKGLTYRYYNEMRNPELATLSLYELLGLGARLLLGIWLLLGSKGIVAVLERTRGRPDTPPPSAPTG